MKNYQLNILLIVSAFALLFYLLSLQHTTQSLKVDIDRLEKASQPSMPEKEEDDDDDNDKPASRKYAPNHPAASSNQRESPEANEVSRILEQSKQDLATQKALKVKYGTAMQSVYINNPKDCDFYWRQIKFQTDMARQRLQQIERVITSLDLSNIPQETKEAVNQYLSLREQWCDIMYRQDVSTEDKFETYKKLRELYDIIYQPVQDACSQTYGSRCEAFKQMHAKFENLLNYHQSVVGEHSFYYKDKLYNITIPEGYTLQ
ncbi:MAG: hypothetical protein IKP58_10220 [Victivallales bacterium]|nr:hypothetical protein [Victivallales bacterium]